MTHDPSAAMGAAETAALDWLMRQRDPAFNEWEAFTDWLSTNPAHQEAYHELAALDADLQALPARSEDIWPETHAAPVAPAPLSSRIGSAAVRGSAARLRRRWRASSASASCNRHRTAIECRRPWASRRS